MSDIEIDFHFTAQACCLLTQRLSHGIGVAEVRATPFKHVCKCVGGYGVC